LIGDKESVTECGESSRPFLVMSRDSKGFLVAQGQCPLPYDFAVSAFVGMDKPWGKDAKAIYGVQKSFKNGHI